ncbi:MAG TPA: glycosyltransferase, partial [Pirellulales bacterium]|nr:glycosyltransferase [Pirellulales bacterium]
MTILVPTYNRGYYLDGLLRQLSDSRIFRSLKDIEIVVANNCSTDQTRSIAEGYLSALPNMRIVNHTVHVASAEENIFRSFGYCNGEYTWVLSDDDVPLLENLPRVLEELVNSQPDFLLTNCALSSPTGEVLTHAVVPMHAQSHTTDILDIAERFGFWYMLAGISLQIVRTSLVRSYDFKPLTEISVIYSHVAAYLDCFHGKKTVVLNCPLMWYVTRNDVRHWKKAARKMNVGDDFFWTLGFIRQLKYLIDRGVVPANILAYGLDSNEKARWRLSFSILERFFRQVVRMRCKPARRQSLTAGQFHEIAEILLNSDPFYRDVIRDIRTLYVLPRGVRRWVNVRQWMKEVSLIYKIKRQVDSLRAHSHTYLQTLYLRTHRGFQIYHVGPSFWATKKGKEHYLYNE